MFDVRSRSALATPVPNSKQIPLISADAGPSTYSLVHRCHPLRESLPGPSSLADVGYFLPIVASSAELGVWITEVGISDNIQSGRDLPVLSCIDSDNQWPYCPDFSRY